MTEIEELEIAGKELRSMMNDINLLIKNMEGQGCVVEIQVCLPFNKIDSITIDKTFKL